MEEAVGIAKMSLLSSNGRALIGQTQDSEKKACEHHKTAPPCVHFAAESPKSLFWGLLRLSSLADLDWLGGRYLSKKYLRISVRR
jgi:hypothetical protein